MTCTLCDSPLPKSPIHEGEALFCCHGCQTVYAVLHSQDIEGSLKDHPLFQEALSSGLITGAAKEESDLPENEWTRVHFEIGGLWCPACAEAISLILEREKGIKRCMVDYATDLCILDYAPRHLTKEGIFQKIKRLGYHPAPLLEGKRHVDWFRFGVSAFFSLNLMMFALPLYFSSFLEGYVPLFGLFSLLCALPLITYCAWPLWKRAFISLRARTFGMETLVLLATTSAFFASLSHLNDGKFYFDSMGMVITLVLLGNCLQQKAKFTAKERLYRATRSLPRRGRVRLDDGTFAFRPLKEIREGDHLVALTGEKIVLDGEVVEGEGACDEALLTGEALPLLKKEGCAVIGGSLLKRGSLTYRVTNTNVLADLLQLVERDLTLKRAEKPWLNRLLTWFVPTVLLVALFSPHPLAVLLISCPCALGIAAPLVEALLLYKLARQGVIVRNRAALQTLGREDLLVFDKTGTLTEGRFKIISGLERLNEHERRVVKTLASHSIHPICVALDEALPVSPIKLKEIHEIPGEAMVAGDYRLGSGEGGTVVFSHAGEKVTNIVMEDVLRKKIPTFSLPTLLLSGDRPEVVAPLAHSLGISEWKGRCTPEQKRAEIEKLKAAGKRVTFVGDGINDAPAMAAANVGISVAAASEMTAHLSDFWMELDALPTARHLAIEARRRVAQNLAWAFGYNVFGLTLAFTGALTPLLAALAMTSSSLIVVGNSLRPFSGEDEEDRA